MTEHETSRTLVKSQPELWAECSDPSSLARHLGQFGEIRITRLEPETTVAWEGERASGTVRLEPSGWGTRVTLTARATRSRGEGTQSAPPSSGPAPAESVPEAAASSPGDSADVPSPPAADGQSSPAAAHPAPRGGLLARLRSLFRASPPPLASTPAVSGPGAAAEPAPRSTVEAVPRSTVEPAPASEPPARPGPSDPEPEAEPPELVLTTVLDSLGQAHRRPFSQG